VAKYFIAAFFQYLNLLFIALFNVGSEEIRKGIHACGS
jgi:hypothetical protein